MRFSLCLLALLLGHSTGAPAAPARAKAPATKKPAPGPNARDHWGCTPLMAAAIEGNLAAATALLKRGADVNLHDRYGNTALIEAARLTDPAILRLLLERKVDVNARNEAGVTALYMAAACGNPETVRLLLEHGADPNLADNEGGTALRRAKAVRPTADPEVIRLLKAAGAKTPVIPLAEAVENGDPEDVRAALARGEDPNQKEASPDRRLYDFVVGGAALSWPIAQPLDEAKVPPVSEFRGSAVPLIFRALFSARGKTEVVAALAEHGTRLDGALTLGITPLHLAAEFSTPEMVEVLLRHGAALEAKERAGHTPLLYAILGRNLATTRVLLQHGANLKAKNSAGWGAVTLCLNRAEPGELVAGELLTLLLDKGADVNQPGVAGLPPLVMLLLSDADMPAPPQGKPAALPAPAEIPAPEPVPVAVKWTVLQTVEFLLARGADPNGHAEDGFNVALAVFARSLPAKSVDLPLWKLLVQHGMKLNQVGRKGMTPLAGAASAGNLPLVEALLDLGAAPAVPEGYPALWTAAAGHHLPVVRRLLRAGADPNLKFLGAPLLVYVAGAGDVEVVRALLDGGAKAETTADNGLTALQTATRAKRTAVIALLKQRGVKR